MSSLVLCKRYLRARLAEVLKLANSSRTILSLHPFKHSVRSLIVVYYRTGLFRPLTLCHPHYLVFGVRVRCPSLLGVVVYLACMSIIGGAYTTKSIMGSVKAGYMKVLQARIFSFILCIKYLPPLSQVTWATSPLAVLIAQKYLDPQLWVLFFNLVSFTLGTTFNVILKKAKLKALADKRRKEREADKK